MLKYYTISIGDLIMPAGRPRLYETAEEMQKDIDKYFKEAKPKKKPNSDDYIFNCPTITGLAYYLGFESRQSLYDYEKDSKFSYTIKRARLRIESQYEVNLSNPKIKPAGSIFALKNIGDWKDKQDVNISGQESSEPIKIKWS